MNMMTPIPTNLTMSSLEIAKLTGKNHADVMRDIRVMFDQLGEDASRFAAIYRDSMNREKPCYHLPKRETLILVSGYSVALRAKIVDRWQELEAQMAARIPTQMETLRLAADAIERANRNEATQDRLNYSGKMEITPGGPLPRTQAKIDGHLRPT